MKVEKSNGVRENNRITSPCVPMLIRIGSIKISRANFSTDLLNVAEKSNAKRKGMSKSK